MQRNFLLIGIKIKMKKLLLVYLLTFSVVIAAGNKATLSVNTRKVEVPMGVGSDIIKLDFATEPKYIDIVEESILTYTFIPIKRELILKGKKPGKTTVRIRNTAGDEKMIIEATVTSNQKSKVVQQLKEYLGDIEGLEIGIKADEVFIGGEIVVPNDFGRINVIMTDSRFSDVVNLVDISPHSKVILAKKIQDEIQANGLKNVSVRVVNGLFWLEGVVQSEGEKNRAQEIANAFSPEQLKSLADHRGGARFRKASLQQMQNFIRINPKPAQVNIPKMIKITAQFVELTKDYAKVFGLNWNPMMEQGGSIGFGKTNRGDLHSNSKGTLSGMITNLFPKLSSAKSAGNARIIQSGVIVVSENTKGHIDKTGHKGYTIGVGENQKTAVSESSFSLDVTPQIMKEDSVKLKGLNIKVMSSLGAPAEQLSNRITTMVVVKAKESAVIGGIVVKKSSTDYDKDPPGGGGGSGESEGESAAQPLFAFVRSKKYLSSRSQFVMFVTPEILESASGGSEKIKRKFRKRSRW